jgi:hypothetical protein
MGTLEEACGPGLLVDKRGMVRYRHIGEGAYAQTEAMIRRLLAESG